MTGHPLRPATRRCLGRPLPHQQADRPRAPPSVRPEGRFHYGAMRHQSVTRYYPAVRPAIPRRWVGCSRVTHPSATNIGEQALLRSFDLHVLGTPPAFVLSQDQTLQKNLLALNRTTDSIVRNYFGVQNPHDERPNPLAVANGPHSTNPVSVYCQRACATKKTS